MEHFLESLKKLKKPSVHSNPEDVDPLFCRYNKGWNDAIEKVEKLINSYSLLDMWIPVDVKLPPEPKPNHNFKGDIYLIATEKRNNSIQSNVEWRIFYRRFRKIESNCMDAFASYAKTVQGEQT